MLTLPLYDGGLRYGQEHERRGARGRGAPERRSDAAAGEERRAGRLRGDAARGHRARPGAAVGDVREARARPREHRVPRWRHDEPRGHRRRAAGARRRDPSRRSRRTRRDRRGWTCSPRADGFLEGELASRAPHDSFSGQADTSLALRSPHGTDQCLKGPRTDVDALAATRGGRGGRHRGVIPGAPAGGPIRSRRSPPMRSWSCRSTSRRSRSRRSERRS